MAAIPETPEFHQEGVEGSRAWLKKLKLHKYWPLFSKWSYNEFMTLDQSNIDRMIEETNSGSMTLGAKQKLLRSILMLQKREDQLEHLLTAFINKKAPLRDVIKYLEDVITTPIPTDPESSIAKAIVNTVVTVNSLIRKSNNSAWANVMLTGLLYKISKTPVLSETLSMIRRNTGDSGFGTDDSTSDTLSSTSPSTMIHHNARSPPHSTPKKNISSFLLKNDSLVEIKSQSTSPSFPMSSHHTMSSYYSVRGYSSSPPISRTSSPSPWESHAGNVSKRTPSYCTKNYNIYLMKGNPVQSRNYKRPSVTYRKEYRQHAEERHSLHLENEDFRNNFTSSDNSAGKFYQLQSSNIKKQTKANAKVYHDHSERFSLWPTTFQNIFLQGKPMTMNYINEQSISLELVVPSYYKNTGGSKRLSYIQNFSSNCSEVNYNVRTNHSNDYGSVGNKNLCTKTNNIINLSKGIINIDFGWFPNAGIGNLADEKFESELERILNATKTLATEMAEYVLRDE